jgi:hypothetical protein
MPVIPLVLLRSSGGIQAGRIAQAGHRATKKTATAISPTIAVMTMAHFDMRQE